MGKNDSTRTVNVSGTLNVTEVEPKEVESSGVVKANLSTIMANLLNKMQPDIKKWYHGSSRVVCLLIYLVAIVYIINEIMEHICYTVNKVEAQGQVIATINNNIGLCSLMLFLLAMLAIICPLLFLIYGNNKNKGQDDYAIANNESYYKMVHHIVNVVSDMEMRDKQKNPQPYITKKDLEEIFVKCLKEQRSEFDASLHNLSEKIENASGNMEQLSQDIKELNEKLPLDVSLIKMEQVVELVKALSANGTAKGKNTFQADKIIVEDPT